jgi:uncharacterized protein (TIGR03545 family)
MPRFKLFRWKAIVPLGVLLVLLAVGWYLFLDRIVERRVELTGAELVGARVDVASADVRLGEGTIVLRGLQVTNPDRPMTNLFEAEEIVVNVRVVPLLEKKLLIDTVALRGMRFGTERAESGALDNLPPGSGRLWREIDQWSRSVRVPPLTLETLGQVVNLDAIRAESLQTLSRARAIKRFGDSLGGRWEQELRRLDPRPVLDSTRTLIAQLQAANPTQLGIVGVTNLVNAARTNLTAVRGLRGRVTALDSTARGELTEVRARFDALTGAKAADLAYARGLLKLPTLEAPEMSPAIFGEVGLAWMRPVLYWVRQADRYLPPGLSPRRFAGPKRPRAAGTTVLFPKRFGYPRFLLEHGEATFEIGGAGAGAGAYGLELTGLTSDPALIGRPFELRAARTEARRGPTELRVAAQLDHRTQPGRDSVEARVAGIRLPTFDLKALGARLDLGQGTTELTLRRDGDQIDGRWSWRSTNATWSRLSGSAALAGDALRLGSRQWAEDLLWRTVSGVRAVDVDVRISGDLRRPALSVRSNIGQVVAQSLRQELGQEVQRIEAQLRARVDSLVQSEVQRARESVAMLQQRVSEQITPRVTEVIDVEARLDDELRKLTRRLPAGLRIP